MNRPALSVERLQSMQRGELEARRALASTGFTYSQTAIQREAARREIEEIDAELKRRGYQVAA